jgi:hypothetical protein
VCLMVLNRLSGRCGHFWKARYDATSITPEDHLSVDREDKIYAFTTCRPSHFVAAPSVPGKQNAANDRHS